MTAAVGVSVDANAASAKSGHTAGGKTVQLGGWAPASGPYSVIYPIAQATAACFKSTNASGGINGYKFNYQVVNDQYNPSLTVNAARLLVQQRNVLAVVDGVGSSTSLAVKNYLMGQQVPHVGPGSGSPQLADKYTFMTWQNYVADGAYQAEYAIKSLHVKKLGVLYQSDSLGTPYEVGAAYEAKQLGVKVDAVSFDVSTQDLTPQVTKLQSDGDKGVIFSGSPANFAPAIQAAQSVSFTPHWVAANYFAVPSVLKGLSSSEVDNMVFASWTPLPNSPAVAQTVKTMKKYYPSVAPSFYTLEGFLSCAVFEAGFKRMTAGGKAPSRAGLVKALNGLHDFSDQFVKHLGYTSSQHNVSESEFMFKYAGSALKEITPFQKTPKLPASVAGKS